MNLCYKTAIQNILYYYKLIYKIYKTGKEEKMNESIFRSCKICS